MIEQEHDAGLRQRTPLTKAVLAAAFLARFPDQQLFLEGLLAQHRLYPAVPLRAVLELAAVYADDALRAAFASAVAHQTDTPQFVRGVLEHAPTRAEPPQRLHVVLAPLLPTPGQRSLRVYQELLEGGRA